VPTPLPILLEDERYLVVDKPAGLLSVSGAADGGASVPGVLAAHGLAVLPVHRLDREVSGALLVARDEEALRSLQDLFRARAVRKVYWGLATGHLAPEQGQLTFPILEEGPGARVSARGKPARTRYRTLERHATTAALELELLTGRKNQIRVHLAHAGHPLVGESKYARRRDAVLALRGRVALHAWRLAFQDPWSGRNVALEAPLPEELEDLWRRARGARRSIP